MANPIINNPLTNNVQVKLAFDPKLELAAQTAVPQLHVLTFKTTPPPAKHSRLINLTDPMMALIAATHARSQIALGELSELAQKQQDANDVLNAVRKLEDQLRQAQSDKTITYKEIREMQAAAAEIEKSGVSVNISGYLTTLSGALFEQDSTNPNGEANHDALEDGDYLIADPNAEYQHQKDNAKTCDDIKQTLASTKDQIRGQVSNTELDMQRMTQEVATATQLESTLSKRWSDLGNTVVGNLRA